MNFETQSDMLVLPPGLKLLVRNAHYIAIPPIVTSLGLYLISRVSAIVVPRWLTILACLLSFPVAFSGRGVWNSIQTRRAAVARGAALAPVVDVTKFKSKDDDGYPRDFLFRMCEVYGNTFIISRYSFERLFTTEPEHVKAILATDFTRFEKGGQFRNQMKSLLGVGVFNADDELWKFHRSMTRPFFSKDRISHFDIFDRHAHDAIQQMKTRLSAGYAVDWQDLVSRFTLDSATEFLFGQDVHSLSTGLPYPPTSDIARMRPTKPEADEFAFAFYKAQLASAARGRYQDAWPLTEFFLDKVEAQKAAIDKFINPILADALQKKAENARSSTDNEKVSDDDTLLSSLLKVTDDHNIIHDETVNILLAGRDTTACTLTFAIYRLAEHPDILQRLREEILSVVGPANRPTLEDIRSMKYLRAVINETLRLYPPVPVNIRCASKDAVLPPANSGDKGIFVRAGMKCIYSVFMMHRRKDLWGPDALKYDPDRFIDERVHKYLTPNPFIFLPFNAGPRICLGQQFAYNEVSFMLVRLLQQFSAIQFVPEVAPDSVTPAGYTDSPGSDGTDRVWMGSHLTMYAKGGLWVKMTEASNE